MECSVCHSLLCLFDLLHYGVIIERCIVDIVAIVHRYVFIVSFVVVALGVAILYGEEF
jgi:hypothetical protein